MALFVFFWMMDLAGVEIILPATDIYNRLTYQTVARRSDDAFFVFDYFEQRILLFEPGEPKARMIARKGPGPGELDRTNAIFIFKDRLYVRSAPCIQVFDLEGHFLQRIHLPPGVHVEKTATGWLASKWDPLTEDLGLYLTNEVLKEPVAIVRWDKNLPFGQLAVPGETMVVPVYLDIGGHVVSKDGERVYYRLPGNSNINIYSISERQIIGMITLKGRFPFDKARGEAEIERIQDSLPRSKVKGKFPDYFPYTNGMFFDEDGYVVIRRYRGKRVALSRFDRDGHPVPAPPLNSKQRKRVVGRQGDHFYVSFQNPEVGDMGICRLPREMAKAFIESNPIE